MLCVVATPKIGLICLKHSSRPVQSHLRTNLFTVELLMELSILFDDELFAGPYIRRNICPNHFDNLNDLNIIAFSNK